MKILNLLRCAKPLIFENDDCNFRYSIQGTCFLATLNSRYYAITAKHCLRGRSHGSVRIRLTPGELDFLPVRSVSMPEEDDQDRFDLAFLEFEAKALHSTAGHRQHFLDLSHHRDRTLRPTEILAVVGYPTNVNSAHYDELAINTRGFSADGRYDGEAEEKQCSKIRFNDLTPIQNLNGLSGSPVLAFTEIGPGVYKHRLGGVLIRGSKASRTGRFINSSAVVAVLQRL